MDLVLDNNNTPAHPLPAAGLGKTGTTQVITGVVMNGANVVDQTGLYRGSRSAAACLGWDRHRRGG